VAVLALGLAITGVAGSVTRHQVSVLERKRFEALVLEARTEIDREVTSYAETLYGLRSLFAVDGELSRAAFHQYLVQSDVVHRLPGARLISFDRLLPTGERPAYEERVRRDTSLNGVGYPNFTVHPPGDGSDLLVADYLEPTPGNEAILGTNVYSLSDRRSAVEEARDSGDLVATAPVDLLSGGRGFILYLAVFDTASLPVTAPARRRHFRGTVATVFDLHAMLESLAETARGLEIDIYDVGLTVDPPRPRPDRDGLVFDSDNARRPLRPYPRGSLHGSRDLNVGSRRWRIYGAVDRPFNVLTETSLPWVVVVSGGVLSLLLAALITALGRSRRLALAYAEQMTADLVEREQELAAANHMLGHTNEQLQEALRARTVFLSVVSHELQTPLTSINGLSQLLSQGAASDGETSEFARRIARNAHTLSVVVDQLVDFTRLEREAIQLSPRPIDLGALVGLGVDQLRTFLSEHDLDLELEPEVTVQADPEAVTRILNNLLSNAVKFSPPGSAIEVRVIGRDGVGELFVGDRGPGVPDADRAHVFEPFFRGSGALTVGTPGTGVGLAVVKELVERMGGSVMVSDRDGGGAGFTVTLPLDPSHRCPL
jgi:signal transduction histidine kinase